MISAAIDHSHWRNEWKYLILALFPINRVPIIGVRLAFESDVRRLHALKTPVALRQSEQISMLCPC
jgi:hypothetical protein